jgi:hypothetical protein
MFQQTAYCGSLSVTFEAGTWAARLHDVLQPHIIRVLVCEPIS